MNRSRLTRYAATGALAMGVITGSLELGSSSEPVAIASEAPALYYTEDQLPAYPNALEYPLGDGMAFNGVPLKISHFTTTDVPERIRDFYLAEFARHGTMTDVIETDDGGYSVTGVVDSGTSKAVVLIVPRAGRTDVFPSLIPLIDESDRSDSIREEDLPLSPHAVGVTVVSDSAAAETVTYHEPLLDPRQLAVRINEEMARRGWTMVSDPVSNASKGALIRMKKPGREVTFSIAPYEFEAQGAMVVAQFEGGAQ